MFSVQADRSRLVSVIIPAYNYAHFLDACLASVFRQDVPLEVIVVDDGSTDDTAAVVGRHGGKVKYIRQENAGPTAARNNGLQASTGDYVQFLDADDLLGEDALAARIDALRSVGGRGVAVCRTQLFAWQFPRGTPMFQGWWHLYREDLTTHLCRLNIAPTHAFLVPREAIEAIGQLDASVKACEDYDLWLRALGCGFPPIYSPHGKVHYRKHEASRSAVKLRKAGLHFDVVVHEKKARGEYGEGVARPLATPAGTIAFCDGLLTTAMRIDNERNPEGKARMIELAAFMLERFVDEMPRVYGNLAPTAKLYATRVLGKREAIREMGNASLSTGLEALERRMRGLTPFLGNMPDAFPPTSYDRQALLSASLKLAFRA
ncbi:MAG: glycosyltransferase family 2 protein [Luteimonas sp.]